MMNQNEIIRLLTDRNCVMHISQMTGGQLAASFGEEFRILKGYDQNNPHHHLDLLNHTLAVVSGIYDQQLPYEDTIYLALSALLHDIGKPTVVKFKADRSVYYDHPLASRQIADDLLHAYGFTDSQIHRILFFIGYHDAFINFKLPDEIGSCSNPHLKPITHSSVTKQLLHIQFESEHEYQYSPTINDFQLLMKLCAADAAAQSETVYQSGRIIDTRRNKLDRIHSIDVIIGSFCT